MARTDMSTKGDRACAYATIRTPNTDLIDLPTNGLTHNRLENQQLRAHIHMQPKLIRYYSGVFFSFREAQFRVRKWNSIDAFVVLEQHIVELLLHSVKWMRCVQWLQRNLQHDIHTLKTVSILV